MPYPTDTYWRTSPTVNGGAVATPALWSAYTTWQYWNGTAWTAAPAGSTPGTNIPGSGDDVLVQGAGNARILLDIDVTIKTLTNF